MNLKDIPTGASSSDTVEVTQEMTVAHVLPGMPEVLSTPMMIGVMEGACAKAIAQYIPEGWVSVGVSVNILHLAATPVGFNVTATATVKAVSEHTITFEVEAHDGVEKVGEGTHVRSPIDLSRFGKRLQKKVAQKDEAGQ